MCAVSKHHLVPMDTNLSMQLAKQGLSEDVIPMKKVGIAYSPLVQHPHLAMLGSTLLVDQYLHLSLQRGRKEGQVKGQSYLEY